MFRLPRAVHIFRKLHLKGIIRILIGRRANRNLKISICVILLTIIIWNVITALREDFINIIDPLDPSMFEEEHVIGNRPVCSEITKSFRGKEPIKHYTKELHNLELLFPDLQDGSYIPRDCSTTYKVAIIIPYRDRMENLITFLYNIIPKLQRQRIAFTIFIAEQAQGSNFNRGMMRNIGYVEALKVGSFDCFVFNDVDTIPSDDRNLFRCRHGTVRHMVSSVDRFDDTVQFRQLFGGIIAIPKEEFERVNGYTNLFFKWGAEDDNILYRSVRAGLQIDRVYNPIGHVWSLSHPRKHKEEKHSKKQVAFMNKIIDIWPHDGLNRLVYKTVNVQKQKLVVWITAEINEDDVLQELQVNTGGQAFPQCVFDNRDIMSGDPLDSSSKVGAIVADIRQRKGMNPEIPPLHSYLDKY